MICLAQKGADAARAARSIGRQEMGRLAGVLPDDPGGKSRAANAAPAQPANPALPPHNPKNKQTNGLID